MESIRDRLRAFIVDQRDDMEWDKQNNYFEFVFGEVTRYLDLMSIVLVRYRTSSTAFVGLSRTKFALTQSLGEGHHALTPEENALGEATRAAQIVLRLDLESVFLFSSILLDRIAAATEFYFGPATIPWKSFRSMNNYLITYATGHGLTPIPDTLIDDIDWLFQHVTEIRHLLLVHKHEKDPRIRLMTGFIYQNDGPDDDATFGIGIHYPKDDDVRIEIARPSDIVAHLEDLVIQWTDYLKTNETHRVADPDA